MVHRKFGRGRIEPVIRSEIQKPAFLSNRHTGRPAESLPEHQRNKRAARCLVIDIYFGDLALSRPFIADPHDALKCGVFPAQPLDGERNFRHKSTRGLPVFVHILRTVHRHE
jgi:hypothetical protein